MIADDTELQVTLDRIAWFHRQVAHMRQAESNSATYRASAEGFLAEIARMEREVREYLSLHPSDAAAVA